jgi:hypothetical protein
MLRENIELEKYNVIDNFEFFYKYRRGFNLVEYIFSIKIHEIFRKILMTDFGFNIL